jgi:hypothetical protein
MSIWLNVTQDANYLCIQFEKVTSMTIVLPGVVLQVIDNTLAVIILLVMLNIKIVQISENIETLIFLLPNTLLLFGFQIF